MHVSFGYSHCNLITIGKSLCILRPGSHGDRGRCKINNVTVWDRKTGKQKIRLIRVGYHFLCKNNFKILASRRTWKSEKEVLIRSPYQKSLSEVLIRVISMTKMGLGHFSLDVSPQKIANNVVEIEAGMIKQYFSSRSWIGETIHC